MIHFRYIILFFLTSILIASCKKEIKDERKFKLRIVSPSNNSFVDPYTYTFVFETDSPGAKHLIEFSRNSNFDTVFKRYSIDTSFEVIAINKPLTQTFVRLSIDTHVYTSQFQVRNIPRELSGEYEMNITKKYKSSFSGNDTIVNSIESVMLDENYSDPIYVSFKTTTVIGNYTPAYHLKESLGYFRVIGQGGSAVIYSDYVQINYIDSTLKIEYHRSNETILGFGKRK